MPERKEIRCYVIPKIANGIIGIMAAFPVIGIVVTIFNGRVFEVAWLLLLIGLFLVLLWLGVRRTYIGVDLEKGTLNGSAFFLPPRRVAIASITHIGAGSMFGSWTVMEVTYQTPGEKKRTGGFGAKETLDKVNFQKILDALMNINPSLQIPAELRK